MIHSFRKKSGKIPQIRVFDDAAVRLHCFFFYIAVGQRTCEASTSWSMFSFFSFFPRQARCASFFLFSFFPAGAHAALRARLLGKKKRKKKKCCRRAAAEKKGAAAEKKGAAAETQACYLCCYWSLFKNPHEVNTCSEFNEINSKN